MRPMRWRCLLSAALLSACSTRAFFFAPRRDPIGRPYASLCRTEAIRLVGKTGQVERVFIGITSKGTLTSAIGAAAAR